MRSLALATALALLAAAAEPARAELRLAGLFGDAMVLQRAAPIPVWGWAEAGEAVQVTLGRSRATARAGADGRWTATLPPHRAGGPHRLEVRGALRRLTLSDVWIGDVWLCAGQSNMEWTLAQAGDAAREVAAAHHPLVRHVKLPRRASLLPQDDVVRTAWHVASPGTAGAFSAVAYHFARRVQPSLRVPIGLVNASWGGTDIEAWTSARGASQDPDLAGLVAELPRDEAALVERRRLRSRALVQRFQGDVVAAAGSEAEGLDDSAWPVLQLPGLWEGQGLPGFDGTVWFRRTVDLDARQAAGPAHLALGLVDDCDETWVNGVAVGRTCGWDRPRRYVLPAGLLRAGRNTVAVRVLDTGGGGGFHGDAEALRLDSATGPLPLHGAWRARVEAVHERDGLAPDELPTLLFNGMIHPLAPMRLRGVLWYQGESNVGRAARYVDALPRLIADWRAHWRAPRLPFLYVQLAAFQPPGRHTPEGSAWAELREAQRLALAVPHTGMAVTIDIGDADDIHPRDKRSVGDRLARLALRQVHGRAVVASGPVLRSARPRADGRLELRFDHQGTGLSVRGGGELRGFALAGADGRYVDAHADLAGSRVHLWSAAVAQPRFARYGWSDNPGQANLVNGAGLPASPFRTDSLPWVTRDARDGR